MSIGLLCSLILILSVVSYKEADSWENLRALKWCYTAYFAHIFMYISIVADKENLVWGNRSD